MPTPDHSAGDNGSSGSDLVGNVTKVADSKLLTILLGPSFDVAAGYLRDKTTEFFDRQRQRDEDRKKNVRDQVSHVIATVGEPREIRPGQLIKIERWYKIAADISPEEDTERAAFSEAVLAEILSPIDAPEYQDVAEQLNSTTARLLLNAPAKEGIAPVGIDQRGFEGLKSLGLVRTIGLKEVLALTAAWCVGTIIGLVALFRLIPSYFPRFWALEFVAEAVVASGLIFAFGIALISTKYRLTEFGRALQRSAHRFHQRRSQIKRAAFLSAVQATP